MRRQRASWSEKVWPLERSRGSSSKDRRLLFRPRASSGRGWRQDPAGLNPKAGPRRRRSRTLPRRGPTVSMPGSFEKPCAAPLESLHPEGGRTSASGHVRRGFSDFMLPIPGSLGTSDDIPQHGRKKKGPDRSSRDFTSLRRMPSCPKARMVNLCFQVLFTGHWFENGQTFRICGFTVPGGQGSNHSAPRHPIATSGLANSDAMEGVSRPVKGTLQLPKIEFARSTLAHNRHRHATTIRF